MTAAQAAEVASWRSSPLTSKTMWSLYVCQVSLALAFWQYLARVPTPSSAVVMAFIAAIAAVGITGVAGLAWTEPAVQAVRALKGQSPPPPAPPG